MIVFTQLASPIGTLTLAGEGQHLQYLLFPNNRYPPKEQADWLWREDAFTDARVQLQEYFAGQRRHFELDLAPQGTPFQQSVWQQLQRIPFGQTWSYRQLAEHLGKPKAMRAVGLANGRNPLPIVIPCHRVIGADGSMTGFGGGIPTKQFLLRLEGAAGLQASLL